MGLLSRAARLARAGLEELTHRAAGPLRRPVTEMTDVELEEELIRRRRARAARARHEGGAEPEHARAIDSIREKQLAQCYANLELRPGASLEDVKAAHRRLMKQYHPDKHAGDPVRHRAAVELAESLTRAYHTLVAELDRS